jgi:predicted  nucleic acid-binding Zn-ribbon protein
MTKDEKRSHAEWAKIYSQLNDALKSSIKDENNLRVVIDNLEEKVGKLEEQLTMSIGVIKYLELQIARSNTVRSNKDRA